jgi:hypothetical protein
MGDSIPADRPRVIVSVMSSADGRVTLRRDRLLMDEDASRVWRSLQPPSAQALSAIRTAELDRLYHPEAILEGSGHVRHRDRSASVRAAGRHRCAGNPVDRFSAGRGHRAARP